MSDRLGSSPFPAADALQPHHKACDVTHRPDINRPAGRSKADGAGPPDVSVQAPLDGAQGTSRMERLLNKCQIKNQLLRECLAEFLGVYVLIVSIEIREGC